MVMLLSDWYLDRREKRIQTAKAEGKTEGKAEVYREISDSVSETVTREVAEARGPRRTGACCVSPNEVGFHWILEYIGRILTLRCVWRTNT